MGEETRWFYSTNKSRNFARIRTSGLALLNTNRDSKGSEYLHQNLRQELTYYLTIIITELPVAATNRFYTFKACCVGRYQHKKRTKGDKQQGGKP